MLGCGDRASRIPAGDTSHSTDSRELTTTLTLAYVAFYLAAYFMFSGLFVTATVHLVLFVMVVRLFSTKRDRDYYFLAVISFLMVLAAAVLTVNSTFLLAFAVFMLMAVVTCILMEMRRASAQATVLGQSPRVMIRLTGRWRSLWLGPHPCSRF